MSKDKLDLLSDLINELQQLLASADLRQGKPAKGFGIEVARIADLKFRMEPDHHKCPHVHIQYGKESHKASFAINGGHLLAGHLPTHQQKVVVKWITENSMILNQIWAALKLGKTFTSFTKELKIDKV